MKTRLIGDVHGGMDRYLQLIEGSERSVQVGDFGIGFVQNPTDLYDAERHRFIRGNHDWPLGCAHEPNWIRDGHVEDIPGTRDSVMFVGGAWSIDHEYRTEGRDWWPDEELSANELHVMVDKYVLNLPKVMVTHEVPQFLTAYFNRRIFDIPCRTRDAFDAMFAMHKPKLWVAGHWHFPFDKVIDGCRFIVLDCDSSIDVDLAGDCLEGEQKALARYNFL